ACVEAINKLRETMPGMAVCCRKVEYDEIKVRLELNEAFNLPPLTDPLIDAYVEAYERKGVNLAGLRTALRQDPALKDLARSPLMLDLMCRAYQGDKAPEDLAGRDIP